MVFRKKFVINKFEIRFVNNYYWLFKVVKYLLEFLLLDEISHELSNQIILSHGLDPIEGKIDCWAD